MSTASGTVKILRREDVSGLEFHGGGRVRDSFPSHSHEELLLGVVTAGARRMRIGTESLVLEPGSSFTVEPGAAHAGASLGPEGWSFRAVYVPCAVTRTVAEELGRTGPPKLHRCGLVNDEVRAHFDALWAVATDDAPELAVSSGVLELVASVFAHDADGASVAARTDPAAIRRARDYLEAHAAEPVTLDVLATVADASKYHLIRMFHSTVGLTPHAYQVHLRIRRAKGLLARGATLGEAAVATGFADQSHFTRHFKRIVGLTPGAYRCALRAPRSRQP